MDELMVSVIVPSHNGEKYLHKAIESIRNQGDDVAEIVIVDDGSTMPVRNLTTFGKEGIKIVRQDNQGQGSAINTGVRHSQGELLAILDHDDYWAPNRIRQQKHMLVEASLDVVVGKVVNEWCVDGVTPKRVDMGHSRVFGACLFRRFAFQEVGPITEDHHIHEVIDWWSRANGKLKIGYSNDVALFRRIHGENQTLQEENLGRGDLIRRIRENIRRNHTNK